MTETYTADQQLRADMWNVAWRAKDWYRAWQNLPELGEVLYRLAQEDVRTVVEIGAAWGGTLYAWRSLPTAPRVVAVTLDDYGDRISDHGATVLTGDSHDRVTLQRVKDQLGGQPVDVLFIDGDHTYAGARADWEMYGPLVRPGGLVLFHDIVCAGEPEVAQLWAEIRADRPDTTDEIIAKAGKPLGFGIVRVREQEWQPMRPTRPTATRSRRPRTANGS